MHTCMYIVYSLMCFYPMRMRRGKVTVLSVCLSISLLSTGLNVLQIIWYNPRVSQKASYLLPIMATPINHAHLHCSCAQLAW